MTLLVSGGLVSATSAAAAVPVGQIVTPHDITCSADIFVQTAVSDGRSYTIPADGILTSFTTNIPGFTSAPLHLVVVREDQVGPGNYRVVGVSQQSIVPRGVLVTTPITPIAVRAGDLIGFLIPFSGGSTCGRVAATTDDTAAAFLDGTPVPGQSLVLDGNANGTPNGLRLSISANLVATGCDAARSPVGCWGFNERVGATTATDVSGSDNDGTYANNPTLGVPGVRSTAVQVDGVNDVVRVPDAASLDIGPAFTAEGWVRRTSAAQSVDLMNKGAGGIQLVVMGASSGSQVFLRKAGVTTIAHSLGGVPADGAYHQVVATMNGAGTAKIYIDGAPDGVSVSPVQVLQGTAFPLTLGAPSGTVASLDEFGLYRQALTAAEVHAHYVAGHTPPPA